MRKHGGQLAVTTYIDGLFERLTLTSASGSTSHDCVHVVDGASRVAIAQAGPPVPGDASPPVAYHLADHLGSSTIVLDGSGAFFNREEYTPYGETSFGSYAAKRYRFTAKERDEETGLYSFGRRYYAPWLARWTSPDPAGLRDGVNSYRYVRGNPLRNVDPTGGQTDNPPIPRRSQRWMAPTAQERVPAPPHLCHHPTADLLPPRPCPIRAIASTTPASRPRPAR